MARRERAMPMVPRYQLRQRAGDGHETHALTNVKTRVVQNENMWFLIECRQFQYERKVSEKEFIFLKWSGSIDLI